MIPLDLPVRLRMARRGEDMPDPLGLQVIADWFRYQRRAVVRQKLRAILDRGNGQKKGEGEYAEGVRPMRPLSATTPLPDRQGGDDSSKENGCEADPYVAGRNIFQQLPFVCLPKQPTDHSGLDLVM